MRLQRKKTWSAIAGILTFWDKVVILTLLVGSGLSFWALRSLQTVGSLVVVEVRGVEKARLKLSQEASVVITGPIGETIVRIEKGTVHVVASACPNKICVRTGGVHRAGDLIICAPNKVVIRIIGQKTNPYDATTG